jgi:multicomponent Na+:H+ antiporter subunit D
MSLLTLYSMIKIWNQAFWKSGPEETPSVKQMEQPAWFFQWAPVFSLVVLILVLGLAAEPVFQLAQQAADQILIPAEYFRTVLGGGI